MSEITYTLLADGTSDRALLPIIDWTLRQHFPDVVIQRQWADFSRLKNPPLTRQLPERIQQAITLYPCDWLFIHRDAERESIADRNQEIDEAWRTVGKLAENKRLISLIPVRMTEAWLLLEEQAIRTASGNPSGQQSITLPPLRNLERLPDPKQNLKDLLRQSSGLTGRRLQKFNVPRAVQLVAENVQDYSHLRSLPAFLIFEEAVQTLTIAGK